MVQLKIVQIGVGGENLEIVFNMKTKLKMVMNTLESIIIMFVIIVSRLESIKFLRQDNTPDLNQNLISEMLLT